MLRWWLILLVGSTLIPPALLKRGGGGGFGRGSSGSRMGGRISSGSRTGGGFGSSGGHSSGGGGIFGGHKSSGGGYSGGTGGMSGSHNMGRKPAGTGFNTRPQDSRGGGWFGRNRNYGGGGGFHTSRYNSGSGRGSFMRSNQFKNMIVGAAAGYLTYQAGKHIIRSMTSPMMWGNRPYYWGQQYYQPRHGYNQMCRMPIQPGDTQFGNIYQQDGISRPKELVWGCGPYEACCGMECCYVGGGNANQPLSVGGFDFIGHRNW
ncbi:unnamed protein product, partial [Mesorhabditis spiculigera]